MQDAYPKLRTVDANARQQMKEMLTGTDTGPHSMLESIASDLRFANDRAYDLGTRARTIANDALGIVPDEATGPSNGLDKPGCKVQALGMEVVRLNTLLTAISRELDRLAAL